jgi:hypothetical protein
MSTTMLSAATRRGRSVYFLRHLLEMTVAMVLGMFAYGALVSTLSAASGSSFENVRLGQPELFALGMAFSMAVPMVAWMRHRGHDWRNSVEMSAAMFVPVLALIVCYWLNVVSAGAVCPLACAMMIPAMMFAMFYRIDAYTTGHDWSLLKT